MHVLSQYQSIVATASVNKTNDTFVSSLNEIHSNEISRSLIFTVLIAICLLIIILLTILGNILVLIALYTNLALRSPTHLLMGNLACADLLLGITVLPFSGTLEILQGRWLFGRIFCHIWLSIDVLYCTASIYGLMFISIERYIGVTRPLRYPILITHRRTLYAILTAWLVAAAISIAPLFRWKTDINLNEQTCKVNDELSYVIFSCSFSFYIPLIIILCLYGRIYGEATRQYQFITAGLKQVRMKQTLGQESVTLRIHLPKNFSETNPKTPTTMINGHGNNSSLNRNKLTIQLSSTSNNKFTRLKRERKAAKTLGIVVGMFILCWLPFFLLLPIKALTSIVPDAFFSVCFWLGYCNSSFNPFIYAFSSREFRKAFKTILRCQRFPAYKSSSSLYRISSPLSDTTTGNRSKTNRRRSPSLSECKAPKASTRKSPSSGPKPFIMETNNQTLEKRAIKANSVSQTSTESDNSSPWHLRKPFRVR